MKHILFPLLILSNFAYGQTITITKGGTYTGTWKADANNPAVLISTSEPVEILNSTITGVGNQPAIKMYGYTVTNIHNNTISQLYSVSGEQRAKAINNYRPRKFIFKNNDVTGGSGTLIDHFDDTGLGDSIVIKYNRGRNMSKAKADGSDGGDHAQFVQFNTVRGFKYAEIAWNECINLPFESWVEDIVSLMNSKGKDGAKLWVHNNFFKGAYPYNAGQNNDGSRNYTGSGITAETNGSGAADNELCENILVEGNQLLETGNAAFNLTSTVNSHGRGNRFVTSGILPNGLKPNYFWSATALFNGAGISETLLATNSIKGNYIMYAHLAGGNTYPYTGRQDERSLRGNTEWGMNRMPPGLNTYGPDRPVTLADIDAEHALWAKKLKDSSVTVGNIQEALPAPVKPPPPVVVNPNPAPSPSDTSLKLKINQVRLGNVVTMNIDGETAPYKTITYSSSNTKIFTITKGTGLFFSVKAVGIGKALATVRLTNLAGKVIIIKFDVEVVSINDTVTFKIVFD